MLEPLAAIVLTSILPTRPLTSQLFTSKSALGMTVRSVTHALPSDFFTPHPRSIEGKGKGKALPGDEYEACSRSLESLSIGAYVALVDEPVASMTRLSSAGPRIRRSSGSRILTAGNRSHIPSPRTWMRQIDVAQRRHASSRSAVEHTGQQPLPLPQSGQSVWRKKIKAAGAKGSISFSAEEAWHAYEGLREQHPPSLTRLPVVNFLRNSAVSVLAGQQGEVSSDALRRWGHRIQTALQYADAGISDGPGNHLRMQLNALSIAAVAMQGRFADAIEEISRLSHSIFESEQHRQSLQGYLWDAYSIIIQTMQHYRRSHRVLDLLVQQSDHLYDAFRKRHSASDTAKSFTSSALDALASIEDPVQLLQARLHWSKPHLSVAASLLIRASMRAERVHDALAVERFARSHAVPLSQPIVLAIIRDLIAERIYDEAGAVFDTLPPPKQGLFQAYHFTGLLLRSRQGAVEEAEKHYASLVQQDLATPRDRASLLHAYAIRGDTAGADQLFHKFYPNTSTATTHQQEPNLVHYTTVIFAHAQAGDLDGINTWLGNLSKAGLKPDLHVYSIVLESLAKRKDIQSMVALIDQIRDQGLTMNAVIYTTLISTLAERGEPTFAERLYKRAVDDGIVPDLLMVAALMHAHVQAGSWHGVIRAWDYINTPGRPNIHVTIDIFNTLLKAYVLIGAPFRTVANVFQQLPRKNLRPDARTFALLIQSACDSGFMDIAEDLFNEMNRLATEENQKSMDANVYVLTILMTGYLRMGKKLRAKGVLDKMTSLGISPNAIGYNAIVAAYGGQKTNKSIEAAEVFLNSLTSREDRSWLELTGGRRLTIETVYRPLLNAYTQRVKPVEVQRLYESMLNAGGQPDLGSLTMLLDAHRRAFDLPAAEAVWQEVYRIGIKFAQQNALLGLDTDNSQLFRGYGCLMCIPLSVYMDALSAEGKHAEVAQVWQQLRDQGLQFDSHNWNHLVVALVRAGDPQRAFDIVENVILRYQWQSRRTMSRTRDMHPSSPLTLDLPPLEEGDLPPHRPEAPLHSGSRRMSTAERLTRRANKASHLEQDEATEDFAHPLHLLHTMSPIWNIWRPHGATLILLEAVLEHLRSGRLVQPVHPGVDMDYQQMALNEEEMKRREEAAGQVLGEIYTNYPQTVQLVREYDLMRRTAQTRRAQQQQHIS